MSAYQAYRAAWARLSPERRARVKLKAQWEHCSLMHVHLNWPSLFDPEREQDADELAACRDLIARRPDLFPTAAREAGR